MPTIPSVESIPTQTTGYAGQPVYRLDAEAEGAEKVGRAWSQALGDISASQKQRYEKQQRDEIAKAQMDFQVIQAQQNAAYDQDQEEDTILERYEGEVNNGLANAAAQISNPKARRFFVDQNRLAVEQGKIRMQGLVHKKKGDKALSYMAQATDVVQKDAVAGGDMSLAQQSITDMWTSMAESGYVSHEVAQKQIIASKQNMALGRLKAMPAAAQLAALQADWVDNLPADVVTELRVAAEAELQDDMALELAQTWIQSDMSMDEINAELAKIDDADMFAKTRTKVLQIKNDEELGKQEMQVELYEEHFGDVFYGGKKIADIPDLDKYSMSPDQMRNMQAAEDRAAKRIAGEFVPQQSDPETVAALRGMVARQEIPQARDFFSKNYAKLNESHYRYFESQVQPSKVKDPMTKGLRTLNQTMTQLLRENDMDKDYAISGTIWDNLERRFDNYVEREGKVPTDREMNEWAKDEFLSVRVGSHFYIFDDDEYIYNMNEAEREDFWEAADLLRQTFPDITRDQIVTRYEDMLRQRNATE